MKAEDWIDKVKTAKGLTSDYSAGKTLGISRATISKYRNGTPTLDEANALKVALALDVDPAAVIIDQIAERAKNSDLSTSLHKLARQLCILCKEAIATDLIAERRRYVRVCGTLSH